MLQKIYHKVSTILLTLLVILLANPLFAQMQENLPGPSEPVSLDSTVNVLVFIVVPLLMIVFVIFWIRRARKQRNETDENSIDPGSEEKEVR